jgi:hypothetical protein
VATTFRIDGRTGFDRLWILISVLWIGLWGVFAGSAAYEQAPDIEHLRLADINGPTGLRLDYTILSDEELLGLASAVKANDETPMARTALDTLAQTRPRERPGDSASWLGLLAILFGPPIATWIIAKALAWAVSRFASPSTPSPMCEVERPSPRGAEGRAFHTAKLGRRVWGPTPL